MSVWTPGPWSATEPDADGYRHVRTVAKPIDGFEVSLAMTYDIDTICWDDVGDPDANAALIALAPTMAAAIMSYTQHGATPETHPALGALGDKLRSIGT